MFKDVIGNWPTLDRFIMTSCDEKYFNLYFPRFFKTYSEHWKLPIHLHIIDPSDSSLEKLEDLTLSYTYCRTYPDVLKWKYSYEVYCQAQRFILLGYNLLDGQSVIVADVDSYALRTPNQDQKHLLQSDMAFTEYKGRLMATFCNFHHGRKTQAKQSAVKMQKLVEQTDTIGVDQLVIKETFGTLPYNILQHEEWIRHFDVKNEEDSQMHNNCLIYHEKGNRGKGKGLQIQWTDIG